MRSIKKLIKTGITIATLSTLFYCSTPNEKALNQIKEEIVSEKPKREAVLKEANHFFNEKNREEDFYWNFIKDCVESDMENSAVLENYVAKLGYLDNKNLFEIKRVSLDKNILDVFDHKGNYLEFKIVQSEKNIDFIKTCDYTNDPLLIKLEKEIDPTQSILDYISAEESKDVEKMISFYADERIMWNGNLKTKDELRNIHTKYLNKIEDYFLFPEVTDFYYNSNKDLVVEVNIFGGFTRKENNIDFDINKKYLLIQNNGWKIACEENLKESQICE